MSFLKVIIQLAVLFALSSMMMVNAACINKERTFTEMPGANNTLRLFNFRYNGLLRTEYRKDPSVFNVTFVPGTAFSVVIKYQFDSSKFNFTAPDVSYNETAVSASLDLSVVTSSAGYSTLKSNSLVSTALSTMFGGLAMAEITGRNRMEAIAAAGIVAAAMSSMPIGYVNAADACPLKVEITITFIPGRWKQRRQDIRDRIQNRKDGQSETGGEMNFEPEDGN